MLPKKSEGKAGGGPALKAKKTESGVKTHCFQVKGGARIRNSKSSSTTLLEASLGSMRPLSQIHLFIPKFVFTSE